MNGAGSIHVSPSPILESLEPRLLLDAMTAQQAIELFHTTPAVFIENQGQWADSSVRFVHKGQGANIAHTDSGPVFELFREVPGDGDDAEAPSAILDLDLEAEPAELERLRFSATFDGANDVTPVGLNEAETRFNFLLGDPSGWHEDVPSYEIVAYEGLYDGIDLHTWGRRDHLKYEFHVAPGADFSQIRISYSGIDRLSIDEAGALHVRLPGEWGEVVDDAPYIYQLVAGEQVEIPGAYRLVDADTYALEMTGDYHSTRPLVIDPELDWSSYLGGSSSDYGYGIAADAAGNVLVTGHTFSGEWVSGGWDTSLGGGRDAFVVKVSPSGEHLWSSYLGGNGDDYGYGIAADAGRNALVGGCTHSSGWVSGGWDTSYAGHSDAFVVKLSASGGHIWSSYLGGSSPESGYGIAADAAGNALVTGRTSSSGWVSGGWDTSYGGGSYDAFVVKLSASGDHLWSSYLGGADAAHGHGIAADAAGNVLATGWTQSPGWVSGGWDTSLGGSRDAFLVKLSPIGEHLWSTYLGGSDREVGYAIAIDAGANALVTGRTSSSGWVAGGWDTSYGGSDYDAFVVKLTPSGGHLWSTYLGGSSDDWGYGIAADAAGNPLVTGGTDSPGWVSGGWDTSLGGDRDAFVVKLSPSGAHLWSSYLGGSSWDYGRGIATDPAGNALVTGQTDSSAWVSGGWDTTYAGAGDGFVAKISGAGTPGGTVSISKPGVGVSEWESSDAACEALDSQWADEGGMVLDPSIWTSMEATPVYRFHLPQIDATAGAMINLIVSVYGTGRDWAYEPSLWAGPEGDRLELASFLPEAEGWSELFAVPLDKLQEAPGTTPGCTLDVVIDAQHYVVVWDWYDVKAVRVSYTYGGLDGLAMQRYQVILDGMAALLGFYDEIAAHWPSAALGELEVVQKLMPSWQTFLSAAKGSPLWLALLEGASLVRDFETLGDVIGWAFDWVDFLTRVDVFFASQANSAYCAMEDLAERWWSALEDDGSIDDEEAGLINGEISTAETRLSALEAILADAGQNLRNIINDPYEDTEVVNCAKAGLATLSAMLRFDPETGDGPLANSYLPALRQEIAGLRFNLPPTHIALSPNNVDENEPIGTAVGTFSTTDPGDPGPHAYSSASGTGDDDNASFTIDGSTLRTGIPLDFEGRDSYSIRVRTTDQGGLWHEKQFTIHVTDVNEQPTDIFLSNRTVPENQPVGTVVGVLSGSDPDGGQSATLVFGLVPGYGDNSQFSINPTTKQLRTAAIFDYESRSSYSIKVRATDAGSPALTLDQIFTVNVTDVDDTSPQIDGWYSRAAHAEGVGAVLLEIPDDGTFSEPRAAGVTRLVIEFSEAIDPASFTPPSVQIAGNDVNADPVDLSGIAVSTSTAGGDGVGVIEFAPALPNVARYVVEIEGVTDVAGNPLAGDNDRVFTAIGGDAYGDLRVNAIDLSYIWANRAFPIDGVTESQTRSDITCDGRVNAIDLSAAWARRGANMQNVPDPVLPGKLGAAASGDVLADAAAVWGEGDGADAVEAANPGRAGPGLGGAWEARTALAYRRRAELRQGLRPSRTPSAGVVTVPARTGAVEVAGESSAAGDGDLLDVLSVSRLLAPPLGSSQGLL